MVRYNCRFLLHRIKPNERGAYAIRMRLSMPKCTPFDMATGYYATDSEFLREKQRVAATHKEANAINRLMMDWTCKIADIFMRFEVVEKRNPTMGEVIELFRDEIGLPSAVSDTTASPAEDFFVCFDKFCTSESQKKTWSQSTIKRMGSLRASIEEFDPHLSLYAINDTKMEMYLAFLNSKAYKNSTIQKNIAQFRWFLRWAASKGYYEGHSHETFKPKFKGSDPRGKEIIYLTQDELHKIEDWTFNARQAPLELARDILVFECFTGLRYSDVQQLKRSDIKDEGNGRSVIDIVTQKTSTALRIELNARARAILNKYAEREIAGGYALPTISNQKMNVAMKEMAKVCEIDTPCKRIYFRGAQRVEEILPKYELITSHVGRRTFVVSALQLGIPAEVIMKWTGHANFDAMKPYIAIVDGLKVTEMAKFDSF